MDPATGELTGVIKDYVELAKDCLQGQTLEFDLKGYDTRNEQLQALHTGEIDLIFHVSQNPYSAETNGFVLSDTIWTFNMAATTAKDSFNENAENTALSLMKEAVKKHAVKSKTVNAQGIEFTAEIRMKDGETAFVNRLNEIAGVENATLVSYNGEYMS